MQDNLSPKQRSVHEPGLFVETDEILHFLEIQLLQEISGHSRGCHEHGQVLAEDTDDFSVIRNMAKSRGEAEDISVLCYVHRN